MASNYNAPPGGEVMVSGESLRLVGQRDVGDLWQQERIEPHVVKLAFSKMQGAGNDFVVIDGVHNGRSQPRAVKTYCRPPARHWLRPNPVAHTAR